MTVWGRCQGRGRCTGVLIECSIVKASFIRLLALLSCDGPSIAHNEAKILKDNIHKTILKLQEDDVDTGHFYVQVLDYLRETAHCLRFISQPIFEYIDNNHPPLTGDQQMEMTEFAQKVNLFFSDVIQVIKKSDYDKLENVFTSQAALLDEVTRIKKRQLKRIKKQEVGTKNSVLYLNTLTETKNLLLYCVNLLKAQRDFVNYNKSNSNNASE